MATHRQSKHSSAQQSRHQQETSSAPILLRLVDCGLLGVLFAVPFALGGSSAIGQLVLVACTGLSATAWALHQICYADQRYVTTRAYAILLGGIALATLQIVSLSPATLASLSPHLAEVLPMWQGGENDAAMLGVWSTLSLTPAKTQSGLINIVAYCLLFVVVVQRIRSVNDATKTIRWVACVSFAMALFGLVQYLTSNGKYFWVLEHYQGTTDEVPLGAFPNRNHFAQFLALGFAPMFVYVLSLLSKRSPSKSRFSQRSTARENSDFAMVIGIAALATVVVTLLFTLSRGGMVALVTSAAVCMAILYWKRAVSGRIAALIATLCLLIGGFLTIHGYEKIATRLDNWDASGRRQIWNANAKVFADFPIFGTGIGSHRFAHKLHWDHPELAVECSHAESSLIQITSECGIVGISLIAIAAATCFGWCLLGLRHSQDSNLTLALAAVTASLSASLIHSVFDVVWHTPGIVVSVIVLAAAACRLYQLAKASAPETVSASTVPNVWSVRFCSAIAVVTVVVASGWAIQRTIPRITAENAHLDYLMLAHKPQGEQAENESPETQLEDRLALLERAVEMAPDNSDLQRHLAYHYYSVFEIRQAESQNPMSAAQIQEAVVASQFASTDEMHDWLDRAIGENVELLKRSLEHARQALTLCPLHASAYVHLAELGFLENPAGVDSSRYLEQARLAHPTNAYAQFTSGQYAWRTGKPEQAIAHWKISFRQSDHYRQRIIAAISENLSAKFLLDNFEFNWNALEDLKKHYQSLDESTDLPVVLTAHVRGSIEQARTKTGSKSVPYWLAAFDSLQALERNDLAEKCLEAAFRAAPYSFEVRHSYGKWLLENEGYAEAAKHLTWCARRRPSDVNVTRLAERAVKAKIQHSSSMAVRPVSGVQRR